MNHLTPTEAKVLAKKECKLPSFWQLIIQRLRLAFAKTTGLSFRSTAGARSHIAFRSWLVVAEIDPVPIAGF